MKQIVTILFVIVFYHTSSGKDWVFELNPTQIRMYSETELRSPTYFLEKYSIKNMVNLSFFTSKSFIPPYKDLTTTHYKNPKQWPFISIESDGTCLIYKKSDLTDATRNLIFAETKYMASGFPLLLRDGKKIKLSKSFFSRRHCPRTAIGIHPNGSILVYVSTSATIRQVQEKLFSFGCVDALNLDGGSSTFLYLDGKKIYSSNKAKLYPNILCWD